MTCFRFILLIHAIMLLGSCASPDRPPPRAQFVPDSTWASEGTAAQWPGHEWWRIFDSPDLDAWVERALTGNPGLRETAARVDAAWAIAGQMRAETRPSGDLSASSLLQRYSENAGHDVPLAGGRESTHTLSLELHHSLDFWGRNRAALRAALGDTAAREAELAAARQLLADEVIQAWFTLAKHLERHALAGQSLALRQQRLQLVRLRVAAGLDAPRASLQADAQVAESARALAGINEDIARSRHVLAELAGSGPQAADPLAPSLAQTVAWDVPEGIPAALLGRRADIVAARLRVEAADARTAQARARFYPDLNLRAFVGLTSLGLGHWLEAGSRAYGVEPAISLPLFDGGRLRAELGQRQAEYNEAVEQYNRQVLRAARDVADTLAGIDSVSEQRSHQHGLIAAAEAAHALALRRYTQGQDGHLTVLAAEATWLEARAADIDLHARALELRAALATALGGGFSTASYTSPTPPPSTAARSSTVSKAR